MILFSHLYVGSECGIWHDLIPMESHISWCETCVNTSNVFQHLIEIIQSDQTMVIQNAYLNITLLLMIYMPFVDVCMMCCFKKGVFK